MKLIKCEFSEEVKCNVKKMFFYLSQDHQSPVNKLAKKPVRDDSATAASSAVTAAIKTVMEMRINLFMVKLR